MITYQELVAWRAAEVKKCKDAGEPFFLLYPDKWYENVRWYCQNGHVSTRFLKSDGSDRCLACGKAVFMGPVYSEETFQQMCRYIAINRSSR